MIDIVIPKNPPRLGALGLNNMTHATAIFDDLFYTGALSRVEPNVAAPKGVQIVRFGQIRQVSYRLGKWECLCFYSGCQKNVPIEEHFSFTTP